MGVHPFVSRTRSETRKKGLVFSRYVSSVTEPRFPSCHPGGIVEAGKLISPVNETLLEPGNAEEEETRGNTIRVQCDVPNTNVVCTVSIPDPCNQGAVEPANPPTVAVTGIYTKQKKKVNTYFIQ